MEPIGAFMARMREIQNPRLRLAPSTALFIHGNHCGFNQMHAQYAQDTPATRIPHLALIDDTPWCPSTSGDLASRTPHVLDRNNCDFNCMPARYAKRPPASRISHLIETNGALIACMRERENTHIRNSHIVRRPSLIEANAALIKCMRDVQRSAHACL